MSLRWDSSRCLEVLSVSNQNSHLSTFKTIQDLLSRGQCRLSRSQKRKEFISCCTKIGTNLTFSRVEFFLLRNFWTICLHFLLQSAATLPTSSPIGCKRNYSCLIEVIEHGLTLEQPLDDVVYVDLALCHLQTGSSPPCCPGVQHGWPAALQGQPGPTQLAPTRFRELGSDWSRPDPALWLVQANLSSNWQKWTLGLSARLPTPPRLFANRNARGISETMEKCRPLETTTGLLCLNSWEVLGFWHFSRLFVQFWDSVWRSEASLEWPPGLELGPRENSRTEASRLAIGRTKFTRPLSDFGHTESGSIQICSLEPIGSGWKQRSMIAAYENLGCKNGQRKHKSRFWSGSNNQIDKDQDRKMTGRPPRQILPKGGKNKIQPLKTCSKAYFQFYHHRAPQRSFTWSTTAMVALQTLVN